MLEYFAIKKIRQHRAAKKAEEEASSEASGGEQQTTAADKKGKKPNSAPSHLQHASDDDVPPPLPPGRPVLDRSDESFLQSILSDDAPGATTSPEQVPEIDWPSDVSSISDADKKASKKDKKKKDKGKGKEKAKEAEEKKASGGGNRLSGLFQRKPKQSAGQGSSLKPSDAVAISKEHEGESTADEEDEVEREQRDINRVLDRMNLSAQNNKVVSMSDESAALLRRFTQVFKDLANGVPTAYDDLVKLISDPDGAINRGFDKLPSSMKKLVTQLPDKLTATIAPELLAAAAKSQGLEAKVEGGNVKDAAKSLLMPKNLLELVTKPGALVGMLRAIVQALQTRWPAFLGVNVLWSIALFLLMFVLWYCHKRGREVRLAQEAAGGDIGDDERFEELPDDPALPAPSAETQGESSAGPSIKKNA